VASKLPEKLGPVVEDPSHPDFYKQNLADLTCWDPDRQAEAVERLVEAEPTQLRREIAKALEGMLTSDDIFLRRDVVKAFAIWAGEENVPRLIGLLGDKDRSVTETAMETLGRLKDPRAIEPLAGMLGDPFGKAVKSLIGIGPAVEQAMLKKLDDPDDDVCANACKVLAAVGSEECIPKLIEIANRDSFSASDEAEKAVKALARASSDPIGAALLELQLGSGTRTKAAQKLAKMEPDENRRQEVAGALLGLLGTDDSRAQTAVLEALVVWHTPEVIPEVVKIAQGESLGGQTKAFNILARIKTPASIRALAGMLGGETDLWVGKELVALGPLAEDAVLPLLDHANPDVCSEACDVLAKIGTKKSIPKLLKLVRSQNFFVRTAAQRAGQSIQAAGRTPVKLDSGATTEPSPDSSND